MSQHMIDAHQQQIEKLKAMKPRPNKPIGQWSYNDIVSCSNMSEADIHEAIAYQESKIAKLKRAMATAEMSQALATV